MKTENTQETMHILQEAEYEIKQLRKRNEELEQKVAILDLFQALVFGRKEVAMGVDICCVIREHIAKTQKQEQEKNLVQAEIEKVKSDKGLMDAVNELNTKEEPRVLFERQSAERRLKDLQEKHEALFKMEVDPSEAKRLQREFESKLQMNAIPLQTECPEGAVDNTIVIGEVG